ncbi:MAG: zinc ribbon domain-containing protein [Acidobacteria bacterium]|nr:zinc ribbon domain-containing protein [Acidobacteriota bacterium]
MNRLGQEFSIISRTGKLIAFLVWLGLTLTLIVLFTAVTKPGDPPFPIQVLMTVIVPVPLSIYALVIAYIHADARRRAMRHVLWTLLAIFIPNAIGILLYFIFREPLLLACPGCGSAARRTFAFCPACGAALQPACPVCRHPVEHGWANCAYCGGRLGG